MPPLLLMLVFIVWASRRWQDRPSDLTGVLSGMVLESVTFALGLWGFSRALAPILLKAGVELSVVVGADQAGGGGGGGATAAQTEPALRQVVTYLGAGLYEEAIFRLVLFSGMVLCLRSVELSRSFAVVLAAAASAILFSTAHHVGPYGQPYSNYLFVFRLAAGLYFALLYQVRGFGIVVGAHACYNVMVSIT
jgi:membrane protease YdiL (CAAX protease family)